MKCYSKMFKLLNRFKPPNNIYTDCSKAVLLLWFTISVILCLFMYVLVNFLFWIAVWPFLGGGGGAGGDDTVLLAFCL